MRDDISQVVNDLRAFVRRLHVASRETEKSHGISGAQLFVLQSLRDGAPRTVKDISLLTMTGQSSVSVVVKRLASKNLVESRTSTSDARCTELRITDEGRELLKSAPETVQEKMVKALHLMPERERHELASLLHEFLERMEFTDEAPGMFFEDTQKPAMCQPS